MRPIQRLAVLALAALVLAACGFKGDLVKPGEEPQQEKADPARRDPVQG
ncbi:MAG TPA: lipoprotein [Xanthomonadales bacterium]|nr:lipoprotein [Xanthomonadales bacterium]